MIMNKCHLIFWIFLGALAVTPTSRGEISSAETGKIGRQVAGYRRDGTGIFPDCSPPTRDLKTQWATELPSWGHSSPITISSATSGPARVYLTVEPLEGKRDFPALICVDGSSGKILWDKPLDHLAAVPVADREPARSAWHEIMADYAKRQQFRRDYSKSKDASAMEAAGYKWNTRWGKVIAKDETMIEAKLKIARKAGFTLETWRHLAGGGGTMCVGAAYATPVSDGHFIWTTTAWGGFFCHDLDGNQLWVAFAPGTPGEYCRNGRSPILWKNLLLSDITAQARAFDAATGKLLWSHPVGDSTIVSPMVLTSGGKDILWAAGCIAFLLPEGTPLTVEGWKDCGMQTLVKYDERDVIFFCGSGEHCGWTDKGGVKSEFTPPAAVRFALTGSALQSTVLWNGKTTGVSTGGTMPWMLYYDKGFYHIDGAILDPLTGAVRTGATSNKKTRAGNPAASVPPTSHLLLTAGGHVYGLMTKGLLSVFTTGGQKVSEYKIPVPIATSNLGWDDKSFCIVGPPFTLGKDRIYARSNIHLLSIGN